MSKNKIWIYGTILCCILIIAIPSTYKVINRHNERMFKNTIGVIIGAAKDCYYNESCVNKNITLKELYEKTNLIPVSNPLTKKIYNENSYVSVEQDFKFIEVEE